MALSRSAILSLTALTLAATTAHAQTITAQQGNNPFAQPGTTTTAPQSREGLEHAGPGERYTAHGKHSLPPGYQDAPSTEMTHGPDPDHEAEIQRDPVSGANLSKFGSAYQNSNPTQQGQLGDSTGNGWVAPR